MAETLIFPPFITIDRLIYQARDLELVTFHGSPGPGDEMFKVVADWPVSRIRCSSKIFPHYRYSDLLDYVVLHFSLVCLVFMYRLNFLPLTQCENPILDLSKF